jgi:hypothetical protein
MVVSKSRFGAVTAVLLGGLLWAVGTSGGPGQAGPPVSSRTVDPVHDCVTNPTGLFIGDVISCVVGQG